MEAFFLLYCKRLNYEEWANVTMDCCGSNFHLTQLNAVKKGGRPSVRVPTIMHNKTYTNLSKSPQKTGHRKERPHNHTGKCQKTYES